jgi:hypothetical protein
MFMQDNSFSLVTHHRKVKIIAVKGFLSLPQAHYKTTLSNAPPACPGEPKLFFGGNRFDLLVSPPPGDREGGTLIALPLASPPLLPLPRRPQRYRRAQLAAPVKGAAGI